MSAGALQTVAGDRWYAVHTQARHENRVCKLIQQEIDKDPVADREIHEVVVPTHEVVEIRKGKRVPAVRPVFPGYLLVRMILNEQTQHRLSALKGVRLVRPHDGGAPQPLREEEVNKIMGVEAEDAAPAREDIPFRVGQVVEIVQGPFADFSGAVQEVYSDKGKVKVEVSLFGRPTSVELDFTQLKGL